MVNNMAADELLRQRSRASAAMVLVLFFLYISTSAAVILNSQKLISALLNMSDIIKNIHKLFICCTHMAFRNMKPIILLILSYYTEPFIISCPPRAESSSYGRVFLSCEFKIMTLWRKKVECCIIYQISC